MLVINPMTADARVDRAADAMGRAGWDVTVIATTNATAPATEQRPNYSILRRPYARPIKAGIVDARQASVKRRDDAQRSGGLTVTNRLRYLLDFVRYAIGGIRLKTRRSTLVWEEYWLSIGSTLPELVEEPTVIHAHDLGPLYTATQLAAHWGNRPKVIYDSHEMFTEQQPNWTRSEKLLWKLHERRTIRRADAVITVSEGIATELTRRYRLEERPLVIHNSSAIPELNVTSADVRTAVGLADRIPLGVYIGNAKEGRGVRHLIEALPLIPKLHLALVGVGESPYLTEALEWAETAECRDRVHIAESVPSQTLPNFLRTASVGIHPMELTCMNHDLALPNKLFDYTFARIPMAVSNLKEMKAFVDRWDVGETFTPGKPHEIAEAIKRALKRGPTDPITVAAIEREFGWDAQRSKLLKVYRDLRC